MKPMKLLGLSLVLTLTVCLLCVLTACEVDLGETPTDAPTDASTEAPTDAPAEATPTEAPTDAPTEAPTDAPTEAPTDAPTEPPTEAPTEPETEGVELNVQAHDLEDMMQSIFTSGMVQNETVMFLDKGDEKTLLFNIDEVISVTSYDGKKTYEKGVDYDVVDGKLVCLAGSAIPCITSEKFYNYAGSIIQVKHDGKNCNLYWGEGTTMTQWQINVTYTHSDSWDKFIQPSQALTLKPLLEKMKRGEDITIICYGDSITYGANASYIVGTNPGQMPYTILFTKALADLFGYNVRFVKSAAQSTPPVPKAYETGAQGTITYVNSAVGGWNSQNGLDNYDTYIKPYIEEYGCDLFLLAFGMNDGATAPKTVWNIHKKILDKVVEQAPGVNLLLMATMVPNPDGIGWYAGQHKQEATMLEGAVKYNEQGIPCAVVQMTSTSQAILERKDFRDSTGNNVNHPNDFLSRIYAQTMLQCVVGYENMK